MAHDYKPSSPVRGYCRNCGVERIRMGSSGQWTGYNFRVPWERGRQSKEPTCPPANPAEDGGWLEET